jgi:aryl-alcohol dehydrogenase-like predicted oxidoreductase
VSKKIKRREFMTVSASTLAAGALASTPLADKIGGEKTKGKLPQRTLGRTQVKVSILGLGGIGFLVDWEDRDQIGALINEAIDSGVNYFDTAPTYGEDSKSEHSLGLVMGTPRREEVFLATKTTSRSYDGALLGVEKSLKRLRTDFLDLIQVHGFGSEEDDVLSMGRKDGVLAALQRLREEKVVRFVGITGHPNNPKLKEAIALYDFDTLLCFINPSAGSLWVEGELLPIAQKKQLGIVAMKTFGGRKPAALVGDETGKAPAPLLLRYALSRPVSLAVPAVANREEFRQNLKLAKSFEPLSDEERQALIARISAPGKERAEAANQEAYYWL